jgi:hypothetical protein
MLTPKQIQTIVALPKRHYHHDDAGHSWPCYGTHCPADVRCPQCEGRDA